MKIYTETSLRKFEPWSGAIAVFDRLTDDELDMIESYLEETDPDGMSETAINDFFWFDSDFIAQMIGFADWDEMFTVRDTEWIIENI